MNMRGLPGNVGAQVPGVAAQEHGPRGDGVDMRDPGGFGLLGGLDRRVPVRVEPCAMQSAIQSTWCSIDTITLVNAEVLPARRC